jgi:hypothetical protein
MLIVVAAVATSLSSAAVNRVIPENNQPTAVDEEEKEESRMKADEEELNLNSQKHNPKDKNCRKLVYRVFRIFVRTWEDVVSSLALNKYPPQLIIFLNHTKNAVAELRAIAQENPEVFS